MAGVVEKIDPSSTPRRNVSVKTGSIHLFTPNVVSHGTLTECPIKTLPVSSRVRPRFYRGNNSVISSLQILGRGLTARVHFPTVTPPCTGVLASLSTPLRSHGTPTELTGKTKPSDVDVFRTLTPPPRRTIFAWRVGTNLRGSDTLSGPRDPELKKKKKRRT